MSDLLPFGVGAWLFIALYVSSLLLLGWAGFNARREDTLRDFYLAGRRFGFIVLLLTLYATQYSGNSLFGVAGASYRLGFGWLIAVHYTLAIIVFYLAFAPKLHALSRDRHYVTPVDYLKDRFDSRAIAWTDVIQGAVLMVGFFSCSCCWSTSSARLLRIIQENSLFGYAVVVLIFSAVLAALMSTADSAMLSISSMFTKDIYGVHVKPGASEQELTKIGKRYSWVVIGALVVLAILLKNQTSLKVWGLHPGLYGLVANLSIAFVGSARSGPG